MTKFEEIIKTLKTHIGEGVEAALEYLEIILDHESNRYNDFIQIKSRYNSLQRELLLGVLDHATYDISRNNISKALLLLAEEITEKDLRESDPKPQEEDKRGEVLYHVPDLMQLNHEEKCTVRIAFEVEQLLRDWEKTEEDVIKSIRVSEIMAVSLLNLDENDPPFAIRTLSETVQFLDKDDFTEWVFYVKPIKTGQFPLVLRVSVIEMINNKEYKKDIVLEERITVQAEEVPPAGEAEFKTAGTSITVSKNPLPPRDIAPPATQAKESGKKGLSGVAGALLTVAAIAAAGYFGVQYYQQEMSWEEAVKGGNPGDYKRYLEKYPNGRYEAEANAIIDSLEALSADTLRSTFLQPALPDDHSAHEENADSAALVLQNTNAATGKNGPAKSPSKAPKPRKSMPAPKTLPGSPAGGVAPSGQPATDLPARDNQPILRGTNFYFKIPRFPILDNNKQDMDFKFYQYNQYREILAVLGSQGDVKMQPGMTVALVPEKGDAIFSELKYVAQTPKLQNRLDAYFTLPADDLNRLANERIKSVRLLSAGKQVIEIYTLSRNGSRNLRNGAEEALKQLDKKK